MTTSLVARARVLTAPADGCLSVELLDSRACEGCCCGKLAEPEQSPIRLDVDTALRLCRGDELAIAMPARSLLHAAYWLHGLPWLGLVAGSAVGSLAAAGDIGCMLGGGAGLAAALTALRSTRRHRDERAVSALRLMRTPCGS